MILVCILNFHQHVLLMDFLECLYDQQQCDFKIIVGDIQSTKQEKNYVEKLSNSKKIYYIPMSENLGYAKGNNFLIKQGLKYYGDIFNYILISNPDIYLENPLTLSKLKMILYNKKNCAVIGPKVIKGKEIQGPYKEQKLFNYILYYLFPFISVPYRKIISTKTKYRSQEGYVWRIIGAFMLIDFQTFKKVGFFDEHTFLYWEEEILSYKLNRIGQQVYYYPNISIKHYHGGGSESKFISNHSLDSMEYYFKLKGYSCLGINCAKKIIKYYNYLIKIYYNTVNRMRRNKSNEI